MSKSSQHLLTPEVARQHWEHRYPGAPTSSLALLQRLRGLPERDELLVRVPGPGPGRDMVDWIALERRLLAQQPAAIREAVQFQAFIRDLAAQRAIGNDSKEVVGAEVVLAAWARSLPVYPPTPDPLPEAEKACPSCRHWPPRTHGCMCLAPGCRCGALGGDAAAVAGPTETP